MSQNTVRRHFELKAPNPLLLSKRLQTMQKALVNQGGRILHIDWSHCPLTGLAEAARVHYAVGDTMARHTEAA